LRAGGPPFTRKNMSHENRVTPGATNCARLRRIALSCDVSKPYFCARDRTRRLLEACAENTAHRSRGSECDKMRLAATNRRPLRHIDFRCDVSAMVWRSIVRTTGCRQNRCWQPASSRHYGARRCKLECRFQFVSFVLRTRYRLRWARPSGATIGARYGDPISPVSTGFIPVGRRWAAHWGIRRDSRSVVAPPGQARRRPDRGKIDPI
jgi:hypothetical protein